MNSHKLLSTVSLNSPSSSMCYPNLLAFTFRSMGYILRTFKDLVCISSFMTTLITSLLQFVDMGLFSSLDDKHKHPFVQRIDYLSLRDEKFFDFIAPLNANTFSYPISKLRLFEWSLVEQSVCDYKEHKFVRSY